MESLWVVVVSYVIGMVPSAYIAARLCKGVDVRTIGDRNSGAANVYRNVSHTAGVLVLAADVAKGTLAILLGKAIGSQAIIFLCGMAVAAGHNWPAIFRFKGGRGLAPTIGVLFGLLPLPTAIFAVAGICSLWTTHNLLITGAIMFAPLLVLALLLGTPVIVVLYALGLLCFAGIMHLVTTKRLTPSQKREAVRW